MNIQGIGQSYTAFRPPGMGGKMGGNGFDPSNIDSGQIMEKRDANLDGVLTADETPMNSDMFSKADTNSDGQLTTEELDEMLSKRPSMSEMRSMMPMMQNMGGGMMPPMGNMMGGGMPSGQLDVNAIFEQEDSDDDGYISSEESLLPEDIFSKIDTDQDGKISADELEKSMEDKKAKMESMMNANTSLSLTENAALNAYQSAMDSFINNMLTGQADDAQRSGTGMLDGLFV